MLRRWFIEDKGPAEGYRWENNNTVVQWLTEQSDPTSRVTHNILCVKKDAKLHFIKSTVEVSSLKNFSGKL